MAKSDREKDFEMAYDLSWSTWGTFQDIARRDVRAVTHTAWTEDDVRRARLAGIELYSYGMIRRIVKLIGGYYRKNSTSIKFEPVGFEDEQVTTQLNKINTNQLSANRGYNVLSDSFEQMLISGINLVNAYQTRDWNTRLKRYPYNSFVLDPNFTEINLSDCQYGIIRQKITEDMAFRLLPGRESLIKSISKKRKEGARDGKFPNMPFNHPKGTMLLNYDEWQRRITQKKKFFIWTAGPLAGQWFEQNGERVEWKGTNEQLQVILQAQPFLDVLEDWVENVEVTVFVEGEEVANSIDPWGIGDFSYTPMMGFWVPEETDIRYKLQGIVRSLIDPQRAQDKERNYILNMWMQQIGSGVDFKEGSFVDPRDAFAAGNKPRMVAKNASLEDIRDRVPPGVPPTTAQHTEQLRGLMPEIVNLNDEIFGTVDSKAQIAGFLGQLRQNSAITGLSDLYDNAAYTQAVVGKKLLKLYQAMPPHIVQRMINEQPAESFYNKNFSKYDAVAVEGIRTDSQKNSFYQELIALKRMGAEIGEPVPLSWMFILQHAPTSMQADLREEMQRQLEQQQQAQQAQQAQIQQTQDLQNQALAATINSENTQSLERQSQLEVDRVNNTLNQVKTIAEVQEITTKPFIESQKIAADLEKERIKAEVKNEAR